MKKKLLCIPAVLLLAVLLYYINLPDYVIQNSMSISYGTNEGQTRDTDLKVIAYQFWNTDGLIEDIVEEHNTINGTPSSLEVNLYHSKWSLGHGIGPYRTEKIEYK